MNSQAHAEEDPVPEPIRDAERWRVAGKILHENDPDLFEKIFAMLVLSNTRDEGPDPLLITESYFLT